MPVANYQLILLLRFVAGKEKHLGKFYQMRNIWGDLENCSGREQFGKCRSLELDSLLGRSSRQLTGRVRAGGKAAHVIRRDGSRSRTSGSPVQVRTWLS